MTNHYKLKIDNECYTPKYAVEPLLKYTPKDKIIWCPCDTKDSEYVKVYEEQGYDVIHSHIDNGEDFFTYEPVKWDIIITNPPFQGKREIVERALSFKKPFALLLPMTWLNDSAPKQLFKNINLELLMFEQRIQYKNKEQNKINFSSGYYCYNLLPYQIIMERLVIDNKIKRNLYESR